MTAPECWYCKGEMEAYDFDNAYDIFYWRCPTHHKAQVQDGIEDYLKRFDGVENPTPNMFIPSARDQK